jgi:cell division protein ZapB
MADEQLKQLESKLDQLIELSARLNRENRQLKANLESLQQERAELLEKNQLAGTRVAAMLERLKAAE